MTSLRPKMLGNWPDKGESPELLHIHSFTSGNCVQVKDRARKLRDTNQPLWTLAKRHQAPLKPEQRNIHLQFAWTQDAALSLHHNAESFTSCQNWHHGILEQKGIYCLTCSKGEWQQETIDFSLPVDGLSMSWASNTDTQTIPIRHQANTNQWKDSGLSKALFCSTGLWVAYLKRNLHEETSSFYFIFKKAAALCSWICICILTESFIFLVQWSTFDLKGICLIKCLSIQELCTLVSILQPPDQETLKRTQKCKCHPHHWLAENTHASHVPARAQVKQEGKKLCKWVCTNTNIQMTLCMRNTLLLLESPDRHTMVFSCTGSWFPALQHAWHWH